MIPIPDGGASTTATADTLPVYGDGPIGGGQTHLTDAQVNAEADHIHSVGDRTLWTDDYDARMRAFAQELGSLDADSAKRLFEKVLEKDPGATQSWLQGSRLLSQVSDPTQRAAVVDAFSQAYQEGKAGGPYAALDFLSGSASSCLNAGQGLTNGSIAQMDKVLNAGDYWDTDSLRQTLGQQVLTQYSVNAGPRGPEFGAAALAVHLTSGSTDPSQTARMFGGLTPDQRNAVFHQVSAAGNVYARAGQADPLTQLVQSVDYQGAINPLAKTSDGQTYGHLSVELIRDAGQKEEDGSSALYPDLYDHEKTDPGRAAAFSQLFVDNKDDVLNTMLDPRNEKLDPSVNDGKTTYLATDSMALGNLLRGTAFEGKNPMQTQVLGALKDYVAANRADLASSDPSVKDQAEIHLGGLAGVASDSVLQLKTDIDADNASKAAVVSFLVDTAVSAIPGGGSAEGVVKAVVGRAFGEGVASELVQKLGTNLIDQATGRLTDQAKDELTKLIGDQGTQVFERTALANTLHDAIYGNAKELGVENDLDGAFQAVANDLARARS